MSAYVRDLVLVLVAWLACISFVGFIGWVIVMLALEALIYFAAWALPLALGVMLG